MAVSGHNGNNETFIGMSASIGLTFYDQNINLVDIPQTIIPIRLLIKRDPNIPQHTFQYVNATQIQLSSYFLSNAFNLISNNASIHIELKPLNWSIGYLIVMKLGYIPIINSSYVDLTSFSIFCPSKPLFLLK